jgi:hypothetical protein
MIVKIQLPLLPGDMALAFTQDKSFVKEVAVTGPLLSRMGAYRVGYFKASIEGGVLEVEERVEGEDW